MCSAAFGAASETSGEMCFAAGYRAKSTHNGSFVYADLTDADFGSASNDTFNVRAGNGVYFKTGTGKGLNIDQGSGYKAGITTNLVYEGTNRLNIVGGIIVGVNQ
jgi:hypothetical protein